MAPGTDEPEHVQRVEPVERRPVGAGQHFGAQRHRLIPAAGPLQGDRPLPPQEDRVRIEIVLVAEDDAIGETPLRLGESPPTGIRVVQVREGPACLAVKTRRERYIHSLAQIRSPLSARISNRGAPGDERIAERIQRAKRFSDDLRPPRQLDRRLMLAETHPHGGKAGIRPRELDGGPERLQDRHRGLARGDRCGAPANLQQSVGQSPQRVSLAETVAGLTPQSQRLLAGIDGALVPADQSQLEGKPFIQPGGHPRSAPEAQRRARSNCAAASRCEPSSAAWQAARGAWCNTRARSPAASA